MPKPKPILEFQGQFKFLSNFYPAPIMWRRQIYPGVEHAYQSAKCESPIYKNLILQCHKPGEAKSLGSPASFKQNGWTLVVGWDTEKEFIMLELLRLKFRTHPELKRDLLMTYPRKLIEGNWWGDEYWGVCNGRGQNRLGELLMQVRQEVMIPK